MHEDFSDSDRNTVHLRNGTIFRHKTARINYTTYDVRRDHDTLNPRNRPFCMVASADTEFDQRAHPFWYAQVIGIFHTEVRQTGATSQDFRWKPMEFLWVRWLGFEPGYLSGRHLAKLPKIGFVPDSDDYCFSFLDPSQVIRGCHLVPAFAEGHTTQLLPFQGPTEARPNGETDDWANYYVNIFVDRDMYMRYLGLGIGHQGAGVAANPSSTVASSESDELLDEGPSDEEDTSEEGIPFNRADTEDARNKDEGEDEEGLYESLEGAREEDEDEQDGVDRGYASDSDDDLEYDTL